LASDYSDRLLAARVAKEKTDIAEKQTLEAVRQGTIAVAQTKEANRQREIAENETAEATKQATAALNNETHALAALSRAAAREGRALDGVELALAAWPRGAGAIERPMLGDAIRYLSLSFAEHPPVAVLNHGGPVGGAIYSPDGKRILSWSWDNTLRLWDAATGAAIGEPLRHEGPVNGAVYSPDGKRILSWSDDKTLRLWDTSWRGDDLFEIVCGYTPMTSSKEEMDRLSKRYGVKIEEPICQRAQRFPIPTGAGRSRRTRSKVLHFRNADRNIGFAIALRRARRPFAWAPWSYP
jgi:hypothetical protein